MNLSSLLLKLYKRFNRTGLLNRDWAQSLFVSSYFAYKKYVEDPNAKLVKNHPELFQGGHILDIGANIGYTAYVFSKAINPAFRIFAFEPEQRNLAILKKAAEKHGFSTQLTLTPTAVGDHEGEIEIWQNDGNHADHRILTDAFRKQLSAAPQTQKTPVTTIDHFLKTQNAITTIGFIKIDVQGYEIPVCEGMKETLDSNPDCVIAFEYCPKIMEALGYCAEALIHFFETRGYFFYRLNRNGTLAELNVATDLKLRTDFLDYIDIICSRKPIAC